MAICAPFIRISARPKPLPHAAGEGGDTLVGLLGKPNPLERVGDALLALGLPKADQACGVTQIVGRGEAS